MLVDTIDVELDRNCPVTKVLEMLNGGVPLKNTKLQTGLYLVNHLGSSSFMSNWNRYPVLGIYGTANSVVSCGVCDYPEQVLEACSLLKEDPNREFCVTFYLIEKKSEPSEGGWRWHKWGEYIGKHTPQCEYLYAEPIIEKVYIFNIYEKVK